MAAFQMGRAQPRQGPYATATPYGQNQQPQAKPMAMQAYSQPQAQPMQAYSRPSFNPGNYANMPDSQRPPAFQQSMQTPWGQMDPGQYYQQRDAFAQATLNQHGQAAQGAGVYGAANAPQGTPQAYNPSQLWNTAGGMVQGGGQSQYGPTMAYGPTMIPGGNNVWQSAGNGPRIINETGFSPPRPSDPYDFSQPGPWAPDAPRPGGQVFGPAGWQSPYDLNDNNEMPGMARPIPPPSTGTPPRQPSQWAEAWQQKISQHAPGSRHANNATQAARWWDEAFGNASGAEIAEQYGQAEMTLASRDASPEDRARAEAVRRAIENAEGYGMLPREVKAKQIHLYNQYAQQEARQKKQNDAIYAQRRQEEQTRPPSTSSADSYKSNWLTMQTQQYQAAGFPNARKLAERAWEQAPAAADGRRIMINQNNPSKSKFPDMDTWLRNR